MAYYDVFLAPIKAESRAEFEAFASEMQEKILGYGAQEVVDLWGDDIPGGELTSLPLAVRLEEGEVVLSGWIIWPSKEVRDAGWGQMMSEEPSGEMPFDGKRMMFGGFTEIKTSRA